MPATSQVTSAKTQSAMELPSELFDKIRSIQIRAQRLVNQSLAGEYESAFKGRGMEFEQVREYQPGDEPRHIDWNVTARMSEPYVKEHREERELTVMLLVDVSASGRFASSHRWKSEIAAELAAVLAYTAIRSNDRVGLMAFADEVELFIPPKKGRAHVWRVIRAILGYRAERTGTDLSAALDHLLKVTPRRVVGFVISDFLDAGFEHRLRVAARRHDLTAVHVVDPRELALPAVGLIRLRDAEGAGEMLVDTSSREVRREYERAAARRHEELAELLRRAGVGRLDVRTDRPYIDDLVRYFRAHGR